jgi:hypothetical protein
VSDREDAVTEEQPAESSETAESPKTPPLFLIKGDASPEEVAALTVVLQSLAGANAPAPEREVRSEWSAHHRKVRSSYPSGPGGWRSSALPR